MDKRPLTAEELLDHLYRGLNMEPPAVQAEMDAQDLRELVKDDSLEPTQPIAPPAPSQSDDNDAAAEARRAKARLALGFIVVFTGALVAGALYEPPGTGKSALNTATAWLESASVDREPVRFPNPFDESEVFEFPAGTTEQEARDAIAGFLLERATERRAHL